MRTVFTHAICTVASLALTAGFVVAAAPAAASVTEIAPPQAFVRTGDLDLRSSAGRATASQRIRIAAQRVCTIDGHLAIDQSCRAKAIADAEHALAGKVAMADTATVLAAN